MESCGRFQTWCTGSLSEPAHGRTDRPRWSSSALPWLSAWALFQSSSVRPAIDDVQLDATVRSALGGIAADSVRIELPPDLPAARADAALAERTLGNLVQNAIRHSPPGEPVRIRASTVRDRIELRVVDRGPGVPDDAQEQIFEPFGRIEPRPVESSVGLGLSVARGFAELMGGSLTAEDTPAAGSRWCCHSARPAAARPSHPRHLRRDVE